MQKLLNLSCRYKNQKPYNIVQLSDAHIDKKFIAIPVKRVNSLNIKVLENESVYIGEENKGFNLAGVYDIFAHKYGNFIPDLENKKTLQPYFYPINQDT